MVQKRRKNKNPEYIYRNEYSFNHKDPTYKYKITEHVILFFLQDNVEKKDIYGNEKTIKDFTIYDLWEYIKNHGGYNIDNNGERL